MRRLLLIVSLCLLLASAGCTFSTDFIVVNASEKALLVTYTIGSTDINPLAEAGVGTPAVLPIAELSEREWRPLTSNEYSFEPSSRTVTVSLPPNQGLLINRGGEWRSNSERPSGFIIERIKLAGINGETVVEGENVFKSFVLVDKPFYFFGPPTQFTLTYE